MDSMGKRYSVKSLTISEEHVWAFLNVWRECDSTEWEKLYFYVNIYNTMKVILHIYLNSQQKKL